MTCNEKLIHEALEKNRRGNVALYRRIKKQKRSFELSVLGQALILVVVTYMLIRDRN